MEGDGGWEKGKDRELELGCKMKIKISKKQCDLKTGKMFGWTYHTSLKECTYSQKSI